MAFSLSLSAEVHVFWRGWGWIVPMFLIAPLVGVELAVETIAHDNTFYQTHLWPKIAGVFAGAAVVALLGYYFNWHRRPKSHPPSEMAPSHDFLLVPMEYWSVIWLALVSYLFIVH